MYVGRGSRWGNPWRALKGNVIGPDWFSHKAAAMSARVRTLPLEDCVVFSTHYPPGRATSESANLFRDYCAVMARDHKHEFETWASPLAGRDLACWCPLDQPCHADVLLELANGGGR